MSSEGRETGDERSRVVSALLLLVLVAGTALRVWYASGELHVSRFEDERYSLRNVGKILATWDFEPASAYYPSPVFNLPQVLALEASQRLSEALDAPSLEVHDGRGFTPTAFLITRLYQTLCGVVTLWLAFLVGRRLASPSAGLLAATVLAFMPWMIHASGYNKPDALLVMAVLLSLHAALRAVDAVRPWPEDGVGLRIFLLWTWAGAAVAIAMSAKITGGFAAVPLTVGALLAPGDRRVRLRRFGLLTLAGAASVVAFLLLNPYWRAYLYFLQGLQRDYAGRTEAGRWEIPWKAAAMHLDGFFLGPILGSLALAAFAGCAVVLFRRRRGGERLLAPGRTRLAMLLAYPVLYAAAYAVQTPYFKPNNFLPTVPFTVLALALWMDAGLRTARRRRPGARRVLAGVLAVAVAAWMVPTGWRYVYLSRVPTTLDVVVAQLDDRLRPPAGHVVFRERWTPPPIPWDGTRPLHKGLSAVEVLDDGDVLSTDVLSPDVRDLAAALVLVRPEPGASDPLLEGWPDSVRWRVEPEALRYRGPPMEVILRPGERRRIGLDVASCGEDCLEAPWPATADDDGARDKDDTRDRAPRAGDVVSFFVLLPAASEGVPPRLRLSGSVSPGSVSPGELSPAGEREIALHPASRQRDGLLLASPRVRLSQTPSHLRILDASGDPTKVQIELHRWIPRQAAE